MKAREFLAQLDDSKIVAEIARAEKGTSGEIRVFVSRREVDDVVARAQWRFEKLGMTRTARVVTGATKVKNASRSVSVWASARLIANTTGSAIGMVTAALLFALNPNLLYLHVTPMTEPLLIAVTFTLVLWLQEWLSDTEARSVPRKLDLILFAAAWTRYEAWLGEAFPATGSAIHGGYGSVVAENPRMIET